MLKKVLSIFCCLALLLCLSFSLAMLDASALAEGAVVLSGDAIVDGNTVYYSGSIDSAQEGVYVMNADGSGVSRLNGSLMTLLSADSGNLLAVSYDEGAYENALVVLNALGERTVVFDGFVSKAIAADGRFYWGVGSCAVNGSDVRTLINDRAHSYNYYPLTVSDGWYYYLDWAENSDSVFFEGDPYPTAARLCRLNLTSGAVDVISGYGTRFLGIENGYIYYSRNNYWLYDEEDTDTYVAEINSGVFRADVNTLTTDQLVAFPNSDRIYVNYSLMENGVIYGTLSDYAGDSEINQIVRLQVDGTQLAPLSLDNQALTLHGIENGVLYASVCSIDFSDDDYIQHDLLYALNPAEATFTLINTPASDLFYYSETPPAVNVANGRIYMLVFDNSAYAISFKSCALDGSNPITLARGYTMAEG